MTLVETKCKDLAGRIASFDTLHGKVETPTIFPVVYPKSQPIPLKEMRALGAGGVITNAYMLWNNARQEALDKGIHRLLGWKGPVMTDSGAFQLMRYKSVNITNAEIIQFQKEIGVDIGVILDVPGLGRKSQMDKNLSTTLASAKELEMDERLWCGPIQGGTFPDLRKKACRQMQKLGFNYYALGSVVPLMNDYLFAENIDIIAACKQALPLNAPVHHFGGGHPMFFAFAVAMGADVFDSAAYSIFAKRGNYMTTKGTMPLSKMKYLPCSCPACRGKSPSGLDENTLARHNLYATFDEIRKIKEAIHEQSLWELLEERARGHPALLAAFRRMKKHRKYLESLDPYTKRRFFYLSAESKNRVELYRHSRTECVSKKYVDAFPFKKVPCEIVERYPFGQREVPPTAILTGGPPAGDVPKPCGSAVERANALAEYQFGVKNLFPKSAKARTSRKTNRIRELRSGKKILASFRSADYVVIPHSSAADLHKRTDSWRVVVEQDTAEFPASSRNVFAKHVISCDSKIRAGMEVLVVDERDSLLAQGRAVLSAREMLDFDSGLAVKTRRGFK